MRFSKNDQFIYASGGHDNRVNKYRIINNKLRFVDSFIFGNKWPNRIGTAGLDIDETIHNKLFVVTKEDNSLYVFDLTTKKIVNKISLGNEAYTCKLSKDKKKLYISSWGGGKILIYDIAQQKITKEIATGNHPNEMIISKNGLYLYVANANDNTVSMINTKTNKVIETFNAALYSRCAQWLYQQWTGIKRRSKNTCISPMPIIIAWLFLIYQFRQKVNQKDLYPLAGILPM